MVDGCVLGEDGDGEGGIGRWMGEWVLTQASEGVVGVVENFQMVEGIHLATLKHCASLLFVL